MPKYYTLITRQDAAQEWEISFGDYDRETVEIEAMDQRHEMCGRLECRVITTAGDTQAEIDKAVAAINAQADTRRPDGPPAAIDPWGAVLGEDTQRGPMDPDPYGAILGDPGAADGDQGTEAITDLDYEICDRLGLTIDQLDALPLDRLAALRHAIRKEK